MVNLVLRELWSLRNIIVFVSTPILLLPLPILLENEESKCAYVLLLMAVYWTTEAIPMAVTGLIPVLLFPLMGLLPVKEIACDYVKPGMIMFVCGLMTACAVEHWQLHKRIALNMILLFGAAPNRLILGIMLPTWFLSMWISNTATTAMMAPIAIAILDQINSPDEPRVSDNDIEMKNVGAENTTDLSEIQVETQMQHLESKKSNKEHARICKAIILSIAYAANVGGTASLIGTGPNIIFRDQIEDIYNKINETNPIDFGTWFMYGLPVSVGCFFVIWFWIQLYFLRCKGFTTCRDDEYGEKVKGVVKAELNKLGSFSFAEFATLMHFVLLVTLWLSRPLGWSKLFKLRYTHDASAAVLVVCSLCIFPSQVPKIFCCRKTNNASTIKPLLTWRVIHDGVPWMIIWLIGGGYALAHGCQESGLSEWIGDQLTGLSALHPAVMVLVLTLIAATITEVTSNTAITLIFLPILRIMSLKIKVHPIYVMFPVTLATSFAFMLPVATPPNAIVFSKGRFKIGSMIKAGFFLNLFCLAVLNIGANTWGKAAFDLYSFPDSMANISLSNW